MWCFWGTDSGNRLYLEVADPSDGTILTSMYFRDVRFGETCLTFAWWAPEAASSLYHG